jgi:aconitate hydratase
MNTEFRKPLPGSRLDFYDARAAVDAIRPGAYATLPYTSRVLAENLVRRCDPATLNASLSQLIERKRDLDFPWFPARVVCHDILGQTALVDLAGLRDAIALQGGDPAQVNPVVPTQLIVDHSLAVEAGGADPDAFEKNRAIEDRRNEDRFHFIEWTKKAFKNVDVIPPGNGIMHQINLEKMSPVIQVRDGVAFPDTCVGTDSHTPHVDALGVIAIGVGGLEAESVMLGRASWMRLPESVGVELTGKLQPGITATDMVLALTEFLRKQKVVGAWLEFFGEGASALTLGDRATISNIATVFEPGASEDLTHGLRASPSLLALRANRPAAITLRGLLVLVQLVMAAMITAPSGICPGTSSHCPEMPLEARSLVATRACGLLGPAILRTTLDRSKVRPRSYCAPLRSSAHRPAWRAYCSTNVTCSSSRPVSFR